MFFLACYFIWILPIISSICHALVINEEVTIDFWGLDNPFSQFNGNKYDLPNFTPNDSLALTKVYPGNAQVVTSSAFAMISSIRNDDFTFHTMFTYVMKGDDGLSNVNSEARKSNSMKFVIQQDNAYVLEYPNPSFSVEIISSSSYNS